MLSVLDVVDGGLGDISQVAGVARNGALGMEEEEAAVLIQAAHRGWYERRAAQKRSQAATRIQAVHRGKILRTRHAQ